MQPVLGQQSSVSSVSFRKCPSSVELRPFGSPGEIRTPVDGSLPGFGVQSPSLAGSLFSTLASPLHHRATRDPGPGPSPNKPSAQRTIVGAYETVSPLLQLTAQEQVKPCESFGPRAAR